MIDICISLISSQPRPICQAILAQGFLVASLNPEAKRPFLFRVGQSLSKTAFSVDLFIELSIKLGQFVRLFSLSGILGDAPKF